MKRYHAKRDSYTAVEFELGAGVDQGQNFGCPGVLGVRGLGGWCIFICQILARVNLSSPAMTQDGHQLAAGKARSLFYKPGFC